jgi:exodeoxyribonuclease VII large subunit
MHLIVRRLERLGTRVNQLAKLLEVVSYKSVLERGFALVSADGEPVRSAAAVPRGKVLDIEFQDGHVAALSNGPTSAPRRKRRSVDDGSQGSLL